MKVKAKNSNRFLIEDEWYEVVNKVDVDNGGYPHPEEFKDSTPGRSIHYELVNHTDKRWTTKCGTGGSAKEGETSWFHEINFYTVQEFRDNILNKLEI
jgi:hypothetical protein